MAVVNKNYSTKFLQLFLSGYTGEKGYLSFYGRLYNDLVNIRNTAPELWKEVVDELEGQKFRDTVDMVLYFEC